MARLKVVAFLKLPAHPPQVGAVKGLKGCHPEDGVMGPKE